MASVCQRKQLFNYPPSSDLQPEQNASYEQHIATSLCHQVNKVMMMIIVKLQWLTASMLQ